MSIKWNKTPIQPLTALDRYERDVLTSSSSRLASAAWLGIGLGLGLISAALVFLALAVVALRGGI
jgi:hypothetical protein